MMTLNTADKWKRLYDWANIPANAQLTADALAIMRERQPAAHVQLDAADDANRKGDR